MWLTGPKTPLPATKMSPSLPAGMRSESTFKATGKGLVRILTRKIEVMVVPPKLHNLAIVRHLDVNKRLLRKAIGKKMSPQGWHIHKGINVILHLDT
jgi:hypothetical protein